MCDYKHRVGTGMLKDYLGGEPEFRVAFHVIRYARGGGVRMTKASTS